MAFILASAGLPGAAACEIDGGVAVSRAAVHLSGPALELRLEDGRIVKLPGLHVPETIAPDARLALQRMLRDHPLQIIPIQTAPDRYGRTVARITVAGTWVEGTLIANGLALAAVVPGEMDCLGALLAAERRARARRLGLWSVPAAVAIASHNTRVLSENRGRFVIVEGVIISVGVRDYATFLNFGRRWTEDLAVLVPRNELTRMEAHLGALSSLHGRRVRVRGYLSAEGAPRLRLDHPEALERLD